MQFSQNNLQLNFSFSNNVLRKHKIINRNNLQYHILTIFPLMRTKKIRQSQCLSPAEILAKVKRQMSRQKQYQKMQQNLLYLNNSFNNNIQIQEIFIDICKGKKKKIKSKQFKTMYTLFSQNKANLCIFEKIVNQQLLRIKNEKMMTQTTFSKWVKDTKYLMEIIEQDQSETQKNIKTNKHIQAQREFVSDKDNTLQKQQPLQKKQDISSMISSRRNSSQNSQQQQELQFLIRRVYCRLIQKILVKISFYTMNNKFLDFIALNILDITKNLEIMIRRLSNIKDLRLLQQIVLKVYRQNLAIESKIYEMLIDGGYILSIDEFYRVNGIDVAHKDVYERNPAPDQNHSDNIKRAKLTLKQKIMKMKQKKERENVVKKQYIDKTNNQINEKYLFCISEIKKLISDAEDKPKQQDLSQQTEKAGKKSTNQQSTKRQSIFSKTQPTLQRTSFIQNQKLSRFSSKFSSKVNDTIDQEKNNNNSRNSVSSSQKSSRNSSQFKKSRMSKDKSAIAIQYSSRISTFSPEFTKLIKSQSANKIQRSSIALSEKFLKFNEFQKKQRKQSKTHSESEQGQNLKEKQFKAIHKKKSSDTFQTIAINKLLRLYEARNTDRYSIDNFLGSSIRLPAQVRQSLRQQLLKLKGVYDPITTNSSRKQTALQVYNFQDRKTLQNSYHLPKKKQEQDQKQNYSDRSSQGHSSNRSQSRNIRFSYPDALLKKQSSLKDENRTDHSQQQRQKDYFSPKIIQTLQQKQDDEYQEQQDTPNIRQTCLVRLSKDRIKKVNNEQKISPINNSLFTACGVKNIYKNQLQDQTPLKNQKLKRIPYIKTKSRFTESNNKKVLGVKKQSSQTNECQILRESCPKIFRRAYHSTHLQNQQSKHQKTVQQVIKMSLQFNQNALEYLSRNQIYYKNKSLHKLKTLNKTSFQNCRKQRVDRFNTFHPKFMDNSMSQNQTQNIIVAQRKTKMKTAHNFIRKSDLSVGTIEKQTQKSNIFEIYDIRKRKKIPK